jgi:hypothetical protein
MKVLEFNVGPNYYEIHILQVGEGFPNFDGGRHTLVARKTPSLIVTEAGPWGHKDTEYEVHDATVWEWIGRLIADRSIVATNVLPLESE